MLRNLLLKTRPPLFPSLPFPNFSFSFFFSIFATLSNRTESRIIDRIFVSDNRYRYTLYYFCLEFHIPMKTKKAYNTIDNTGGFKDLFNDNTLIFRSQMKIYKNKAQTIKKCRRVYYIYISIYIVWSFS